MLYAVKFHPDVEDDLKSLGRATANKILDVIEKRIKNGEPEKAGKPLRKELKGLRRIRTGDTRIIYRVIEDKIEVLIVAVGPRRNNEIYNSARKCV